MNPRYNKGVALGPRRLRPESRTQVLGVGFAMVRIKRKVVPHFMANCGPVSKKFNINRLGKREAFVRALRMRAAYELSFSERSAV